jgi:hypothetical protein
MRMLRITGCSNSSYWYAGKIGSVVPYIGEDAGEYITREPSGYVNIVKCADAELVDVTAIVPKCMGAVNSDRYHYRVSVEVTFNQPDQLDRFDPTVLEREAVTRLRDLLIYRKIDAVASLR